MTLLTGIGMHARAEKPDDWRQAWWLVSQSAFQQQPQWVVGDEKAAPAQVPLGSLWKLLVYSYTIDQALEDKMYQCQAGHHANQGDAYCCSSNETITRNVALARSCGEYFSPERLDLTAQDWQQYWKSTLPEITWLQKISEIKPEKMVSVAEILMILNRLPKESIKQSRHALVGRILQPQWSALLPTLGGAYRFKTYTWSHPQYKGAYFGGAAGWLADGTAFWLGGTGGSRTVLLKAAPTLSQKLSIDQHAQSRFNQECVVVRYFNRYPIKAVSRIGSQSQVKSGALHGKFAVAFNNGRSIPIQSQGELVLHRQQQKLMIRGQFELQEYLARVIDREADAKETEAAKALSIAARSYLYQNAAHHHGCWQINDDSRHQRVSPNPASHAARSVVAFTEGLSLIGTPIRYHLNKTSPNVLNWQTAVKQSLQGNHYVKILFDAYPKATWRIGDNQKQCQIARNANQYLQKSLKQARRYLRDIKGYEYVKNVQVCQLDYGNPFADTNQHRIYIRDWRTENDKISLWHEYLHLALRYHPNGHNESLVEDMAQQLVHARFKKTNFQSMNY